MVLCDVSGKQGARAYRSGGGARGRRGVHGGWVKWVGLGSRREEKRKYVGNIISDNLVKLSNDIILAILVIRKLKKLKMLR